MKKISIYLFMLSLCLSCNKTEKKEEVNTANKEVSLKEEISSNDVPQNNDFENYLRNFENLPIEKYNSLYDNFFIYLDKEFKKEIKEISKDKIEKYLKNINHNHVYYGFKTKLDSGNWILIYYLNSNEELPNKKKAQITEVTFFKAAIYDSNGTLLDTLNIFGADMSDDDPTYNLQSNVTLKEKILNINSIEYYYDINQPHNDSIVKGNIKNNNYQFNNETNKFKFINSSTKNATFSISLNKHEIMSLQLLK